MLLPEKGSLIADKYRLEAMLGEGGMGAVYRARHELIDRAVALKWLKPALADGLNAKQRFLQEARASARIRHPNVVDVYDVGEHGGALFMVMELLEGETFGHLLERADLPLDDAIRLLTAAMRGVAAAHAKGITHRDIKPDNIFISIDPMHPEGVAKILDFGISKLQDAPTSNLTSPGSAMGTPHYMSWEQMRGDADVDHRTDVYAFGVLLYRALTGRLPYDGNTLPAIVMALSSGECRSPLRLRPDLPRELDRIVMKAMALKREDRFQTLGALIAALEAVPLNQVGHTRTDPSALSATAPLPTPFAVPGESATRKRAPVLGVTLLTVAAAAAAYVTFVGREPSIAPKAETKDQAPRATPAATAEIPRGVEPPVQPAPALAAGPAETADSSVRAIEDWAAPATKAAVPAAAVAPGPKALLAPRPKAPVPLKPSAQTQPSASAGATVRVYEPPGVAPSTEAQPLPTAAEPSALPTPHGAAGEPPPAPALAIPEQAEVKSTPARQHRSGTMRRDQL
jgi:eukaryotic-like serine/threonine-protein kinase